MTEFDLIEALRPCFDELEKIGLYMLGDPQIGILPTSMDVVEDMDKMTPMEVIKSDHVEVFLSVNFALGQVAWSERVLNPKEHEQNKEFGKLSVQNRDIDLEMMVKEIFWDEDDPLD